MHPSENNSFRNALSCINSNDQLNKLISETIFNIDRQIESIKDNKEYLLSQVKTEDQFRGSYITQVINGRNNILIRSPYFMTPLGLTPPTSEMQKNKMSSGSFDFYELKRQLSKICSQKDLDILKDAIGRNVYDIENGRITNSSEKTRSREFSTLNKLSYTALAERCDSYMIDKIDWLGISVQALQGRLSAHNCRKLWEQTFNPEYPIPKWTDMQCDELLRLTSEIGSQGKWVTIASKMSIKIQPYRCFKKWLELTSKMETSHEWTAAEDDYLRHIIKNSKEIEEHNRTINWNKIALMVSNRSARDCEKRWTSLQTADNNRPFTDDEDYLLLLLIKRMSMENWSAIAMEMKQRTIEQCQRRYCEIVEELHPWTYIEDRQLWLRLRPQFRELWDGNKRIEDMTTNLSLYKSIIKHFSGRCPLVIRHRYLRLCKWFYLWNRFYLCFNSKKDSFLVDSNSNFQTSSLLSDICPEQVSILSKIKDIILQTSFFDALRKALYLNGSKNPDSEANELIVNCKHGNSKLLQKLANDSTDHNLMEFLMFIIDLQNGKFIPRQFEKYIHRSDRILKNPEKADSDLRCLSSNVRSYEIKTAMINTLKKRLNDLYDDSDINDHDRKCIETLLNNEGKFISSLNFAVDSLQRTHDFNFVIKVDILEKALPRILKLMVQYIYDQKNQELKKKSLTVHFNNKFANKREQIAQLLIYRHMFPDIYKTYQYQKKSSYITRNLPSSLSKNLLKEDKIKMNTKKVCKILSSHFQQPLLDKAAYVSNYEDLISEKQHVDLFTPNKCTLHLLRTFFLQKHNLIQSSDDEFIRMVRLKYDHPIKYLKDNMSILRENPVDLDSLTTDLNDPKYIVLKMRIMSLLTIPSVIARISPFTTALIADKLHENQNNERYSTVVSNSFNSISKLPDSVYRAAGSTLFHGQQAPPKCSKSITSRIRKRKILECIDDFYDDEDEYMKSEKIPRNTSPLNQDHPHTRSLAQNYLSIYLPDCKRYVFVSKDLFQPFIAKNFTIESINGVNVKDFMDE